MVKFIFCDVDGVLNSEQFGFHGMDPMCVGFLLRIIEQTNCKIVVSSTWRLGGIGKGSEFQEALLVAGGRDAIPHIVGATPDLTKAATCDPEDDEKVAFWWGSSRADEIKAWLKENAPDANFVAVDDDSLPLSLDNFVRTDSARGLTAADADEVIHKLLT